MGVDPRQNGMGSPGRRLFLPGPFLSLFPSLSLILHPKALQSVRNSFNKNTHTRTHTNLASLLCWCSAGDYVRRDQGMAWDVLFISDVTNAKALLIVLL